MTSSLRKLRNEREYMRAQLEDAAEDLQRAQQLMEEQQDQMFFQGILATAAAAIAGGILGTAIASRRQASSLTRMSQDLIDLRRRGAAEVAKVERYGVAPLAKSLIPTLDAMDQMCAHATDAEGASLTRSTLHTALREHGIEQVAPGKGDVFDTATMEAVMVVPAAEKSGLVETLLRPGYTLHNERILRAAQVGVGQVADDAMQESSKE